jgi:DNA-binding phage protein
MTDNQLDPVKVASLPVFDIVDYLNTDAEIAEYLFAILEVDGKDDPAADAEMLRSAILDVIQALRKRTA